MGTHGVIAAITSAILLLTASWVAAEPAHIRVQLDSSVFCPEGRIRSELRARSPRIDVESPTNAAAGRGARQGVHSVRVRPGVGAFSAHIEIDLNEGERIVRDLSAKDCEELSAAIGFVIAVTLDPPHSNAKKAGPRVSDTPPYRAEPRKVTAAPVADAESQLLWVEIGGGAQIEQGVAPLPLVGVVLSMGLAGPRRAGGGLGWPSVRAGFVYSMGRYAQVDGTARFSLAGVDLTVSPFEYNWGRLHLRPAAFAAEALLSAAGLQIEDPRSASLRWLVVGGSLETRLSLGPGWLLSAIAGVGAPVKRYEFEFDPVVFHSVPPWVVRGSFGLGRRF